MESTLQREQFHGGHLKAVLLTAVLILGISWMKNPQLFSLHHAQSARVAGGDVPHYYAYVTPAEDLPLPQVAGANTNQGPSIINEDGTVTPVEMTKVLGAATEGIELPIDKIAVKEISDSDSAIRSYFDQAGKIESGFINNADFEQALSSGDQRQINLQAAKLESIQNNLLNLSVPLSLVKLQKLKVVQYQAAVGLLDNFTKADDNPELVGQYLQQFLKAQADMDTENQAIQKKYHINLGYAAPAEGDNQSNVQP